MHCHNSIRDFPPCLLFASTEGECSFFHQLNWNLSDAFFMHSARLCGVVSWDADLHPWAKESKRHWDSKPRMSQTSVETVEAKNSKISPHLLSFAQSCFCKQVHGYTASPQVKPLKYLEITSRFCCCSILHCCPCLHEETTGKTASTRSGRDVSEPTFWACVGEMPLLDPAIWQLHSVLMPCLESATYGWHAFISSNGRTLSAADISSGRTGMS